jgi:hypothetical protein
MSASATTLLDVMTPGGVVEGTKIIRVSSLADSGAGSLREALRAAGPRVVVFDVAGYIELHSDLTIENGQVTIAGQTAPGLGVILRGGTINIRASDIVIEHVAIYAGSSADPKRAANRDGINIYGRPSRKAWLKNVVLRNLSVGWGVDENIGINGLVDGVKIERSLIAEALTGADIRRPTFHEPASRQPGQDCTRLGKCFRGIKPAQPAFDARKCRRVLEQSYIWFRKEGVSSR